MSDERIADRLELIRRLTALASGQTTLEHFRAWTGDVVAADDWDVNEPDAQAIAAAMNAFEDELVSAETARPIASRVLAVLHARPHADVEAGLIALAVSHSRLAVRFQQVTQGRISRVALTNALSRSNLTRSLQDQIRGLPDRDFRALEAALAADDYSRAATLLTART